MDFFASSSQIIHISPDDKLMEGKISKESKYRKVWREYKIFINNKK